MKKMTTQEKAAFIETLHCVIEAKDDGTTHQFTKGGERKYYSKFDYYVLNSGAVLRYEKPGIDRELWYDDEGPGPYDSTDEKRGAFIRYNMWRNFTDFGCESWCARRNGEDRAYDRVGRWTGYGRVVEHPYVIADPERGKYHETIDVIHFFDGCEGVYIPDGFELMELDQEEVEEFMAIADGWYEDYVARLEKYYRRYGDKICARGYWANR